MQGAFQPRRLIPTIPYRAALTRPSLPCHAVPSIRILGQAPTLPSEKGCGAQAAFRRAYPHVHASSERNMRLGEAEAGGWLEGWLEGWGWLGSTALAVTSRPNAPQLK